jgi:hypothetical protein
MFAACDGIMDTAWDKWDEVKENTVNTTVDTFKQKTLEQIGGDIHPTCRTDCWQVMALGVKRTRSEHLPSETVMTSVKVALSMLVHEDPNQTTPAFILKEGFQFTEVAVGVGEKPGKCWYRNDVHGMKYFASTYCPGRAAELGDKLWLPQNWRHVHCVDDAPDIVVSHLMGKSRLEYLVLPCPHLMSGVMARGIQFDDREALVLTWRQKFELKVGEDKVEAYMIWSKSAMHPKIPGDDDHLLNDGQGQAFKTSAGTPVDDSRVEPKPQRNNGRQLIKARGVLLFDSPMEKGQVCVIAFGHENTQSGFNNFGRAAHYVGLGGLVGGGATQIVEEQLGRIRNIGHPF